MTTSKFSFILLISLLLFLLLLPQSALSAELRCAPENGPSVKATIVGTNKADNIQGTSGNDVIVSLDGSDRVSGGEGNDIICTGAGLDIVKGGVGNDTLRGEGGADQILENKSSTTAGFITGGDGNDKIEGSGNILASGGSGDDLLIGVVADFRKAENAVSVDLSYKNSVGVGRATGVGTDELREVKTILGSRFDDILEGDDTNNYIDAGAGDDILLGDDEQANALSSGVVASLDRGGSDTLIGNLGKDQVYGFSRSEVRDPSVDDNNKLYGDSIKSDFPAGGNDLLKGGGQVDRLKGGVGNDALLGEGGEDEISGQGGNDFIYGGQGSDKIDGGENDDSVIGDDPNQTTGGRDIILGGEGNDDLRGEANQDKISGGNGNDTLRGGAGHDLRDGQAGKDRCPTENDPVKPKNCETK